MAEVDVKKQKSGGPQRQERGLARRSEFFPSLSRYGFEDFFGPGPFRMMRRMMHDMERAFGMPTWPRGTEGEEIDGWWPAVEVSEEAGKLNVSADLPGIKPEEVKVEVTDDSLIIKGERKQEHEERGKGYYRSEKSYGHFYRCVPLPEGAKTDEVQAEFRNGELKVIVPVPEVKAKRREIPVKAK
jgi:HSP20 family protein